MESNVGGVDRVLRVVVGAALVGLAVTGKVGLWGWIGVMPVITGFVKFCPAYKMLGISSCR